MELNISEAIRMFVKATTFFIHRNTRKEISDTEPPSVATTVNTVASGIGDITESCV